MHPLLAAPIVAFLAALAVRFWWSNVNRRFGRVTDGVFRSGALPHGRLRRVVRRHGIRTVFDFRKDSAPVRAERAFLETLGVVHVHLPSQQVPPPAEVDLFLRAAREAEHPILFHCKHGAGRTAVYSLWYLVEISSWTEERAARRALWSTLRVRRKIARYGRETADARLPAAG